jgi:hypothetical protein
MAAPSNLARCRIASTVGHCDKAALYGIFIPTISAIRRARLEILLAGFDNWPAVQKIARLQNAALGRAKMLYRGLN